MVPHANKYPWLVRIWNRDPRSGQPARYYPRSLLGRHHPSKPPTHPGYPGFCGGTLVATRYVITAAHCVEKKEGGKFPYYREFRPNELTVRIGDHNLEEDGEENIPPKFVDLTKIIKHPNHNRAEHNGADVYDIAILELAEAVDLTVYTPACLARRISGDKFNGKTATAVGWGWIQENPTVIPDIPYEVDLTVKNSNNIPSILSASRQDKEAGTCKVIN